MSSESCSAAAVFFAAASLEFDSRPGKVRDEIASLTRFITIGMSRVGRALIVAHSDRGENIRIISARKTTLRERKQYEEEN
ncbi:MAG: hypothetical protein AUG75_05860 [Cyanobacteria bacterium 13_1_20CM_4_61_6]|nr:MAG: hypothetical protein AUG75_05860 [Cyanobacteria bacterium 13_1_20CM_4_61_6]